jgi:anaerobic ribonucleoside-triphosphate reductase activating protein
LVINIHSLIKNSRVNGPGDRFVIWTQGCRKGCKNCYNPETWSHYKNNLITIEEIINQIKDSNATGVTISGGDPFEQPREIFSLLEKISLLDLKDGVIVFTGYTIEEIKTIPQLESCLKYIDLLIDGRYFEDLRISSGLAGSSNQQFHFLTDKISREEVLIDQEVEIHFSSGLIQITGFPIIDRKELELKGIKILNE